MRTVLVMLFAAMMIAPMASAESSATMLVEMASPSKMVMKATASIEGEEAAEMRAMIDQYTGDNDGTVEKEEVDAAEGFFRSFMDQNQDEEDEEASVGGDFTIDGKGPSDFRLEKLDITGAEGPVSSQSAFKVLMEMSTTFDVQAGESHIIKLAGDDTRPEDQEEGSSANEFLETIESAKFRAAPGYIFSSVEGMPAGARVSGDKKEIDLKDAMSAPTTGDITITMSKGGPGGSAPGIALPAVLLGLMALAFVVRRR